MNSAFTESTVEEAALVWLENADWRVAHGPDIVPDMPAAERADNGEVLVVQHLRDALARRNLVQPVDGPVNRRARFIAKGRGDKAQEARDLLGPHRRLGRRR
jgi:hypothetical protein